MILVTGGAGFIGSALVWGLNERGRDDIIVVDHLGTTAKWKNLTKRRIDSILHKDQLFDWLAEKRPEIDAVFHMGACSATTELDVDYLVQNNFQYSMRLYGYCAEAKIPFIYASSAATYGDGELGFSDNVGAGLRPVNPYGYSKHLFDTWLARHAEAGTFWAGLKFFNVYGPQEYHKGPQSSVVYQAFFQIRDEGKLKLFKSYREGIGHGEQKRDFVYVKDVVKVMLHLYDHRAEVQSGVYNLGSGEARSWKDLGSAVFRAMAKEKDHFIWIDMPEGIRDRYQYFTEATLENLRAQAGYNEPMTKLEDGVRDYICNYMLTGDPYL